MRKRTCLVWLLAICLTLALQTAVFAEERQELFFWETVEYSPDSISLLSNVEWESTSNTYYDQLPEEAKGYYNQIKTLFEQEKAGQIAIPKEALSVNGTSKDCWVVGNIATGTLSGTGEPKPAFEEWISVHAPVVSQAGNAFVMDHPEYFWIRTDQVQQYGYSGTGYGNSFVIECRILLGFGVQANLDTVQKRQTLQTQIDNVVDDLISETKNLKDEQKIAYWDNWLAVNNRYNGAALAANYIDGDATPWCTVGALLDGYQPVCEGYAKALQLLCHKAGIPCVQVSGEADGGGHMWTAVKLNNNWYFCDPTWDDPNQDAYSWNYSKRAHLLTTQPGTHTTLDRIGIGTPTISSAPFFEQRWVTLYSEPYMESVVPSEWQLDEQAGVCGLEIGNSTMVIALYGEGGKFLGVGTCEAMRWSASEYIYLAPAFDRDLLEQAVTARRLNITDALTWTPVTAALPIE